jgi:hypothetical protein
MADQVKKERIKEAASRQTLDSVRSSIVVAYSIGAQQSSAALSMIATRLAVLLHCTKQEIHRVSRPLLFVRLSTVNVHCRVAVPQ